MEKNYDFTEQEPRVVCDAAEAWVATNDFDRDWARAISVDEFHQRCKNRLAEIYG